MTHKQQAVKVLAEAITSGVAKDALANVVWPIHAKEAAEQMLARLPEETPKEKKLTGDGYTVTYDDSPEAKDRVFKMLLESFYAKHEAFCGETIMQCDDPQIAAPEVLSEVAEKGFKFKMEYDQGKEG